MTILSCASFIHPMYMYYMTGSTGHFLLLQRQIQTAVFGGKSSVKGAASGTASSVAFTPLQVGYFFVSPTTNTESPK